jgi:cobalt transporter subunit CbtB
MTTTTISTAITGVSTRLISGLMCLFLGAGIIFMTGFSEMSVAHNAAHDTRHAIGFPCH